jgi:ATP-dependent helicase Lhr and Lhr-like helicase
MVKFQKNKYEDPEIFNSLNPLVQKWFKSKFKSFSDPQRYAVINIRNRENTLISSPTGSGKTLSAFLSIISELTNLSEQGKLEDKVYCIYISPLKALANDIKKNLSDPLKEIKKLAKEQGKKIDIRTAIRTGDTSPSDKSKMLKNPPHILITTPESLAIILCAPKFKEKLSGVEWVIIDEIHALASSKRGVHLSLSLERLQNYTYFTRIGLSATVAPLEEIAKFLVGMDLKKNEPRNCKIVDAQFLKKLDLKVLSPVENLITSTHEEMHQKMYELIDRLIQDHRTTLIFTNTRSATERVVHHLKEKFPKNYTKKIDDEEDFESFIGAHHGSLSRGLRLDIENKLKEGKVKCVVSSTSLELGIDIGYIDLVILLGSPKSVARALQRIGRSGHKLHDKAKGRIIVLNRDDLVECSVLLKAALDKKIDKIDVPRNALDVLAQQIYGMAIEQSRPLEEVRNIVKSSYCYNTLSKKDFDDVVDYLAGEYTKLEDRNVYAKIWVDKETGMIGRRGRLARVLYMTNIGTIPSETKVIVKIGDQIIGTIEEAFLERLKRGDIFVLGGSVYEFLYSRGMTAQVRGSVSRPPTVPSWFSESLPLSFDLAMEIQQFRRKMENYFTSKKTKKEIIDFINQYLYVDKFGANSIYEYFRQQFLFSEIPSDKKIVVEHYSDEHNKYVIFHTLFGRRTNDVLARALAFAVSRLQHKDVEISITDNGFFLQYTKQIQAVKAFSYVKSKDIRKIMELALEKTEVLKRRFRHCATRALMILRNYKGREKSVGKQQVSSMLLINAVKRISTDFPILKEARREVMEDLMDIEHAKWVIEQVENRKIKIKEVFTDIPSPFAFNLIAEGYTDIMRIEDKSEFLKRMHNLVLAKISLKEGKKKQNAD